MAGNNIHSTLKNSRRNSNQSMSSSRNTKRQRSSITKTISNGSTGSIASSNEGCIYQTVPTNYTDCDKRDLLTIIARMLSGIVRTNDFRTSLDLQYLNNENLTRFHSRSPPEISIFNYLLRLAHYSSLENCVLIVTVYYIDLLTQKYPSFALNSLTVHRFLLTATTIASKALCDSFCSNSHYAKVGGVNILELNLLEVEFLKCVNYRVVPRDFNYDSYCERKNSSGNVDMNLKKSLQYGISTAGTILDLYYEKMVGLVGGESNEDFVKVGNNDNVIYTFGDETSQSVSSSSSEEYEDFDEYGDLVTACSGDNNLNTNVNPNINATPQSESYHPAANCATAPSLPQNPPSHRRSLPLLHKFSPSTSPAIFPSV